MKLVALRIVTSDVGSLLAVTWQAGERKIGKSRWSGMLLSPNVIQLERTDVQFLEHPAVFTPSACSVPNSAAPRYGHRLRLGIADRLQR